MKTDCDEYAEMVEMFCSKIANSGEMRSLARAVAQAGVAQAPSYFPELAAVPDGVLERLAEVQSVATVSAVVQERAHLLARASVFAKSLPENLARGLEEWVRMEIDLDVEPEGSTQL